MICPNCKEEVRSHVMHMEWHANRYHYVFVCSPKAERSEAAPRCPNSAPASSDARASDEAGADSLGRSADKAVRALVVKWRAQAQNFRSISNDTGTLCGAETGALIGFGKILDQCADELEAASPALAAERERACLPNNDSANTR